MNKRIKRIIATTLAVSAFSALSPATHFNLTTEKVYASTSTSYALNSLRVNDGSSSDALQLYDSSSRDKKDEVNFTPSRSTYYVETSSNGVNVTFDEKSGYYAKVKRGSSGAYDSGDRIHIANGDTMTLHVEVYDKSTDKRVDSYSINVKQTSSKSSSSSYHYYDDDDDDYDDDDAYLEDIKLSDGDISFSSTKSTYTVNVDSSVDEIRVRAIPEDDDSIVKVNGNTVYEDDDYKEMVPLNKGKNEITIRVRNDENRLQTYTLYVYRGGSSGTSSNSSSGEVDNFQDDIYLDDLIIDNNSGIVNMNFRPKVTTYNVNVSDTCDSVILRATPEDEDNIVRINGDKVNTKNARRVNLNSGKNVIEVKVDNSDEYERNDDDYKNRIYTINVYRGVSASTTNTKNTQNNENTNSSNASTSTVKTNQWVAVDGRWQFNDYSGKPTKNEWFYDSGYKKWFYLDSEGFMKTGWLQSGPAWYYFNTNGTMATGWIEYGGKYYHFGSNGVMDHDTTIDRYVLGSDGAWIG